MSATYQPIVFTDLHHAGLLQSLILLFEKRLGGKIYRPIGKAWYDEGYWHVYDHPFTIEQFLSTELGKVEPPVQMYPDGTRPLNIVDRIEDGIFYCNDIDSGTFNKAITLDKFWRIPFDIVIASIPQHIEPFKKLCQLHPNHPKLIYQIGNAWPAEAGMAQNVMASALIWSVPSGVNFITYHQEFDTDIFCKKEPNNSKNIFSFVNCFNIDQLFAEDWGLFLELEKTMPDWEFRSYGGQCRDGAAHGTKELAEKMDESRFIFHLKATGDGFGHVIFNSFAVGRPPIVKRSYYDRKLAGDLMDDEETCLVVDDLSPNEIKNKIEYWSEPNRYAKLCSDATDAFKKFVDFDREEQELRVFLDRLQ